MVPGTQHPDETRPQQQDKRQPAVVGDAPNLNNTEQMQPEPQTGSAGVGLFESVFCYEGSYRNE